MKKHRRPHMPSKVCFGKIAYASADAAQQAINAATWRDSGKLRVYQCQYCSQFHIGHARRRVGYNNTVRA